MRHVHDEARRDVDLIVPPTIEAIGVVAQSRHRHQRNHASHMLNRAPATGSHAPIGIIHPTPAARINASPGSRRGSHTKAELPIITAGRRILTDGPFYSGW